MTTTTRAIGPETMEREATSAPDAAVENADGDTTHRRARAAMMASHIVCRVFLVLVYRARPIYLSGALESCCNSISGRHSTTNNNNTRNFFVTCVDRVGTVREINARRCCHSFIARASALQARETELRLTLSP